jgi:hypothetical protein
MNLFTLPFTLIGTVLACCTDILQHLHNPKACRSTRGSTTGSRANLRASRRRRQPSIGSRANVTGGCWQVHLTHNVHVYNVRLCHFHAGTGNHQLVPTPCKLCTHTHIYIYICNMGCVCNLIFCRIVGFLFLLCSAKNHRESQALECNTRSESVGKAIGSTIHKTYHKIP